MCVSWPKKSACHFSSWKEKRVYKLSKVAVYFFQFFWAISCVHSWKLIIKWRSLKKLYCSLVSKPNLKSVKKMKQAKLPLFFWPWQSIWNRGTELRPQWRSSSHFSLVQSPGSESVLPRLVPRSLQISDSDTFHLPVQTWQSCRLIPIRALCMYKKYSRILRWCSFSTPLMLVWGGMGKENEPAGVFVL